MTKLAPSILSADFTKLGEEIKSIEKAGADYIHIDVMDGEYVPSISFGMPVIKCIRPVTDLVFDVHLMINEPIRYVEEFASIGADIITVHAESCKHLHRTVMRIKELGVKVGVAINPATPVSVLEHVLSELDLVLIMSVNPGFGGQKFISFSVDKIREAKEKLEKINSRAEIQIDGGITLDNVKSVIDAGVDVIVAGTSVFSGDIDYNVKRFKETFVCT